MRALSIAEWLLCRLTSRQRAASIIGDLIEIGATKRPIWLWFSITRVILAHLWRRPAAFIAAFYAGSWAFSRFQIIIFGIHAHHPSQHSAQPLLDILSLAGNVLWIGSVYSVIRFGLRDRFAQLVLAVACLVTVTICYWWQPGVLTTCVIAAIFAFLFAIRDRQGRRTAAALPPILVIGCCGFLFSCYLLMKYMLFISSGPLGSREFQEHPSLAWAGFCACVLWSWIMTSASALAHRWVMRRVSSDSKEGEGSAA